VPLKTCDFNCIYCQLGRSAERTLRRADYVPVEDVVKEVKACLERVETPDYITLGGSGEPTLHLSFGRIAELIKEFTDIPIALLTNGSLFHQSDVRAACAAIDLIMPSLDAGDGETFQRVNRPHPDITLTMIVDGLVALREEFKGQIWLEVLIVEGVNSSDEQVRAIREKADLIRPDRIQVNTVVRPPAYGGSGAPSRERLEEICTILGPNAEVIAAGGGSERLHGTGVTPDQVRGLLRRRPCTVADISEGLGANANEVVKVLAALVDEGVVRERRTRTEVYYEADSE
jgi:wyosine [tRNA(Phe)-imidazoG37] synthetase (radical SAM superfamily)